MTRRDRTEARSGPRGPGPAGGGARALPAALLLAVLAALATGLTPVPAAGQTSGGSAWGTGARLQVFSFSSSLDARIDDVTLLTVPVAGRAEVGEGLTLEAGGYYAYGQVDRPDGSTSSLSGLTDATVRASLDLADNRLTLTALGRVPSGPESYTLEELDVLGVVASDLFPFRISNWGKGGGVGLRATTRPQLGGVNTLLSVGYFRSGEFDPLERQLVAYQPGDNLDVRAGATVPVGAASQLSIRSGFRTYAEDELEDTNVFEAGDRWHVRGSYSFPVGGEAAGFVYGGFHRRDRGTALRLLRSAADQDLVLAGGGFRFLVGQVRVRPTVDARLLRRGDGRSEGEALRVGGSAEWGLGEITLIPVVRGHLGQLTVRPGTESGFVGFDLGLTVRSGGMP